MGQFYNKFRRLFTEQQQQSPGFSNFLKNNQLFLPINNLPQNNYSHLPKQYNLQPKTIKNITNIGKSPALDQFQYSVLPFLQPIRDNKFQSLKSEMKQNTQRLKYQLNQNTNKYLYQLPQTQTKKHLRVNTEPSNNERDQQKYLIEQRSYEIKDDRLKLSRNLQQLQKQYLKYKNRDQIKERERIKFDQKSIKKPIINSPIINNIPQKLQEIRKVSQFKHSAYAKRWGVKLLPTIETQKTKIEYKILKNESNHNGIGHERQLYGLNQNPYAFVNSKLSDIKKSQKSAPRGYINDYRGCLIHRRNCKNQIQIRRNRLRQILHQQEIKYRQSK